MVLFAVFGFLVFAVLCGPVAYSFLATSDICYHDNEKQHVEACALARQEFSTLDTHTRTMYRFLQVLDDR
jgi:hypothetical protein